MKLPRDISGEALANGLKRVGYEVDRQRGDHLYMTTQVNGEHHVSVPLHNPVKVGMLSHIIGTVSAHLGLNRQELLRQMRL